MGADHLRPRTGLEPFQAVLAQRDAEGQPFIIVGGQAANFWAAYYLPREPRLEAHFPFTSKDLDLIGTKTDAERVAAAIHWHARSWRGTDPNMENYKPCSCQRSG